MSRRTYGVVAIAGLVTIVAVACSPSSATTTDRATSTQIPTTSTTTTTSPSTSTSQTSVTTTTPQPAEPSPITPLGQRAFVLAVTDGDTLEVSIDGVVDRVRLIGINANESGECFSDEATAALSALVDQREIRMVSDQSDRDIYDRLLRYIYVDDVFVNERLVATGAAIARRYPPDTAEADRLEAAQSIAKAAHLGMWADDACGTPAIAGVVIEDLQYDAPGNDNENLNGEWIAIHNNSGVEVSLDGWVVKDESASHRYPFPPSFTLGIGARVTLFTGCGSDTNEALFWCNIGSAVWNNSGDTGFLLDPSGNIVSTFGY